MKGDEWYALALVYDARAAHVLAERNACTRWWQKRRRYHLNLEYIQLAQAASRFYILATNALRNP